MTVNPHQINTFANIFSHSVGCLGNFVLLGCLIREIICAEFLFTVSLNWKWLKHVYFKPLNLPKGDCRVSQVLTPAHTEQGLLVL